MAGGKERAPARPKRSAEDTFYGDLFDVGGRTPHTECCGTQKTFREWDAAGGAAPGERARRGDADRDEPSAVGCIRVAALRHRDGYSRLRGDPEYAPMWAGESCSVVNEIKPAAAIVHDIAREAEALLAQTPAA